MTWMGKEQRVSYSIDRPYGYWRMNLWGPYGTTGA